MIIKNPYRVAVVGAGHNGLIAGAYLAKAGYNVTIYERNSLVGGCCTSKLLDCGCNLSRGATHFGMLSQHVINDLDLAFELKKPDIQHVCLSKEWGIVAIPFFEIVSGKEKLIYEADKNSIDLLELQLADSARDLSRYVHSINPATRLLKSTMETLRKSTNMLLCEYISNPSIRNALIAGTSLYPHNIEDPGSAFNLVYLSMYSSHSKPGWSHVKGGMGIISETIAETFIGMGGRLVLSTKVDGIRKNGTTEELTLITNNGQEECFDFCIAAIDPVQLHEIMSTSFLDVNFSKEQWKDRNRGVGLKINGILNKKPIPCASLKPYFDRCPDTVFVRHENHNVFYDKLTRPDQCENTPPVWELTFPSLAFDCESCSRHVTFSVYSNPHPYLHDRDNLDVMRSKWSAEIFDSITEYFPNFYENVEWYEVLTPNDLESEFNITVGNVDHGDMAPSNRLDDRSRYLAQNHNTRHDDILFGASGSMPGGLVTGIPGFRSAKCMIKKMENAL